MVFCKHSKKTAQTSREAVRVIHITLSCFAIGGFTMKIAFDVDVLSKQMSINDLVHQVADWGYKYIEQSPHPRINPFYKHPLFSKECEEEYRKALK